MLLFRFDVLLAALFLVTGSMPVLLVRLGSWPAKLLFVIWFLLTWGSNLDTCLRPRHALAVLVSFLGFIITFYIYMYFTEIPGSQFYGLANAILRGHFWTFSYWLILHYYLSVKNALALKQLAVIYVLVVAATAVLTVLGIQRYGDTVVRAMVTVDVYADSEATRNIVDAMRLGAGSFSQVYGMTLMIAPLLFCARYLAFRLKIWCFILSALLAVCVLKASFLTAVLTVLFGFLVLHAVRQKAMPASMFVIGSLLIIILVVALLPYTLPPILDQLAASEWINNNEVYQSKVNDLQHVFSTKSYIDISRFERIQWSWNGFMKKPFFGNGFHAVGLGGHSEVFDTLGRFGLIGVLPTVLFLVCMNRYLNANFFGFHPCLMRLKKTLVWPFVFVACFNPIGQGASWSAFLFFLPILPLFFPERLFMADASRRRFPMLLPWWCEKTSSAAGILYSG